MDVTVALSAIIVLMYKNASSKIYTILLIALSIFGLMSVSKSFLFAWMLLMLCWFILSIKQGVGKFTKFMFVGIIGAALAYYFAYDYINTYLFRFTEDSDGTLDSITTGRWEIWSVYLKTIFNDTKILFLGNGLNTIIEKIELGAHNTYLEMLFALGIVGTIILMIALRISIGQAKFKGVVLIPVAILLVRMVAISILSYDNLWFYLAILEMLVCEHQKKDQINLYDRR